MSLSLRSRNRTRARDLAPFIEDLRALHKFAGVQLRDPRYPPHSFDTALADILGKSATLGPLSTKAALLEAILKTQHDVLGHCNETRSFVDAVSECVAVRGVVRPSLVAVAVPAPLAPPQSQNATTSPLRPAPIQLPEECQRDSSSSEERSSEPSSARSVEVDCTPFLASASVQTPRVTACTVALGTAPLQTREQTVATVAPDLAQFAMQTIPVECGKCAALARELTLQTVTTNELHAVVSAQADEMARLDASGAADATRAQSELLRLTQFVSELEASHAGDVGDLRETIDTLRAEVFRLKKVADWKERERAEMEGALHDSIFTSEERDKYIAAMAAMKDTHDMQVRALKTRVAGMERKNAILQKQVAALFE